ncbi:MAG: DNA mismatch repair endonuclease MutL [Firmicutes bacterium]|nr:DNA mismatch repair endonuclease MutL [Bacillota bacterium]
MSKIHVLDFEVANLIAAGEVVDRPASVIKELLENAIDSGAHTITVEVKRGGVAYMRVTDNGCGISLDDLPTSILRHATSKISNADDLEHIGTLGFRGEALAAIASVSKLRIISRPEGEEKGGILIAEGGSVVEHSEIAASAGTSVIVEELFANVPARRKFLKKDVSETAAIFTVVERIALSRPDISFRFIADGTMKLRTEGNGDLKSAIYSVLGREFWARALTATGRSFS